MNKQKKRIAAYFLFVCIGFAAAFLFLKNKTNPDNTVSIPDATKDSIISVSLLSEFYDMENNGDAYVSTEKAVSGKKSCKLSSSIEYGFSITKIMKNIPSFRDAKSISLKFMCLSASKADEALYVLSIDNAAGKNVLWAGQPFVCPDDNNWTEINIEFPLTPELLEPDNKITLYPWNRSKKEFFIDDILFDITGTASQGGSASLKHEALNLLFDFETEAGLTGTETITETTAHSGKKACPLLKGKEYGPVVSKKLSELGAVFPKKIALSVWVYPLTDMPEAVLTASVVNSKNETVFWEGKSTGNKTFPKNKWTKINASYILPIEKFTPDDILGVSIWNKGKTDVIIDDLEIVYGESPERRGSPSKIDATTIYEKRFIGEKNKPPFRTIFFQKQEINNLNKSSITADPKDVLSPNDQFLVGDLFPDKQGLDELLCIQKNKQALYSYSPERKQFKKLWENTNVSDSLWNEDNSIFCGDHNADGKTDILLVNKKNNTWILLDFNGKKWTVALRGENPKKEWMTKKVQPTAGLIGSSDIVLPGNYNENKPRFLKLNTDWRFDLKLIEQDGSGYNILANVDFAGYPDDHNPKYYEFVKLIPGNFISKGQTSLLVVMCNCADQNFTGRKCGQIENLSFLPNSIQLYRIEEK